ncbi:TPA: hypothetical protein TXL60_001871 [Streptococcus suis]|nr:hypothetical protein [Streptococcus suis]
MSDGSVNSLEEAEQQAKNWLSTQHALHDPDQIAGGFANNVTGIGDANINKAIGSQWKNRIGTVGIETSLNGGLKSINPDSLTTFL